VAIVVWPTFAVTGWFGGFVMFGNFTLLLKLSKMEDLRLAKLQKDFIQL
jgi:hypothetical protein